MMQAFVGCEYKFRLHEVYEQRTICPTDRNKIILMRFHGISWLRGKKDDSATDTSHDAQLGAMA